MDDLDSRAAQALADIERTAPEALHTVRPVTTICGGKITYQA